MAENKKINISESMSKLEKIVGWFEEQQDVDIEEGIKKVKEGAVLIKSLKERLKEVDNEFREIKKDLEV